MRKLKNEELERLSVEEFKTSEKLGLTLVLDEVRSLNNVGSFFRTADAFLIDKIVLCGITARPPHKDIHKTALGATETVHWEYEADTLEAIQKLQQQGIRVLAVEQAEGSTSLQDLVVEPDQAYALVFGHEVKGVKQEVVSACDEVIEIPQYGTKHSLNVSVSAGILLWEFFRRKRFQALKD